MCRPCPGTPRRTALKMRPHGDIIKKTAGKNAAGRFAARGRAGSVPGGLFEGDSMKTRMRYRFTGYVQGVGFRYRAYYAARLLGLTGWVRNESDGSVAMEVQGERRDIEAMLAKIEHGSFISIDRVDAKELPTDPRERSFEARG